MKDTGHDPIRRVREHLRFANRWVRVYFDDVDQPDGPGQYTRIEEGASQAGAGVVVIARNASGRILLIRTFRYPVGAWSWELPRGFGEAGESVVEAAGRELWEEVGLRAGRCVQIGSVFPDSGLLATRIAVVLADRLAGNISLERAEAISDHRWISLDEAFVEASAGVLRDAISLAALAVLAGGATSRTLAPGP